MKEKNTCLLRLCAVILLISVSSVLPAQLTYGTTGLLNMPSAEMQKDKTVMIGGNFLNKEITPTPWYYHTYNYYLNITFLSFVEFSYVSTLFDAEHLQLGEKDVTGFTNQDRQYSIRIRLLKEGQLWKHMPAVVIGTSDPTTGRGEIATSRVGNGYFCRFYIAATKHLLLGGTEDIGIHAAYIYNRRFDNPFNGPAVGISYNPSFQPQLRFIAEYNSKDVSVGATYSFFNHLQAQILFQRLQYFSGGLTFSFVL
jgi:hypothetical protein